MAWVRLGVVLRHWVGGIFTEMVIMGVLTGLGLWLAGIEGALTLGLLTFFATFIPYLGVHIVEGYIASPLIMRRAVKLRPGVLLFWQALMGVLFGVVGIIVATPLLACLDELLDYLYIERTLKKTNQAIDRKVGEQKGAAA